MAKAYHSLDVSLKFHSSEDLPKEFRSIFLIDIEEGLKGL